jgi:hypothetical protein
MRALGSEKLIFRSIAQISISSFNHLSFDIDLLIATAALFLLLLNCENKNCVPVEISACEILCLP